MDVPGAADEPDRGGRPGRLHDRRADGVREAVGGAFAQRARAPPARAARRCRRRPYLGDACELAGALGGFDLAYIDPPYNQHRYFTNYHIWETLVAWDAPEHYGVACKRVDARDDATKSAFNERRRMPAALAQVIATWTPRRGRVVQRRGLGDDRRAGGDVPRRAAGGADARVRLEALRRRPDRHPQPTRREGRAGVAPAQRRVRRRGRRPRTSRARGRESGHGRERPVVATALRRCMCCTTAASRAASYVSRHGRE